MESLQYPKIINLFRDGILKVSAIDKLTGRENKIDLRTSMGRLTKMEIERMVCTM